MGKNESGVISIFKRVLQSEAEQSCRHFDEFPLGPQDRHLLGDDLWVTYNNFAIVEMKWSEAEIRNENAKIRRVKLLCKGLAESPEMAAFHAKCHRIAWRDSQSGRLMSQEYRNRVCCLTCPDTCVDIDCGAAPLAIEDFAKEFFGHPPSHCLPLMEFQSYVKWLTTTVTGAPREVIVLALNKSRFTVSEEMTLDQLGARLPALP
ncbi:hypothetical protein [Undibacterium sp. YM2]|uniref:hypothetical protein n=1 Tax=Undibacterium sp. YM2 TaxID=2058625 RepID=UPI001389564C|nr:hypothetical protein [Undibacterium sp. YM2]